ncbi:MAG: DUF3426 domain-containing protein [Alphaproteobacteria bacterium]
MILTCPACSTRYRTDPDNFRPEGRRVRCSACGDVWFQTPPPEPEQAVEPESPVPLLAAPGASGPARRAPSPAAPARAEAGRHAWSGRTAFASSPVSGALRPGLDRFSIARTMPRRWQGAIGWLVLAAVIVVPLSGALLFRTEIVNAWPKAARVYSALGIPVTSNGLLIHADYTAVLRDGRRLIEVRGEIENQGPQARSVPPLRLALYDGQRRELYRWVVPVNRAPLNPSGKRAFRTTFPAPGKDVNVQIRFSEDE